ncbi:MAG: T9SS type A sorting domain-containing protein [Candidatus Latescibacteria bacterium]|nr:T9SS type A sorting domain-containing protein [Candidatus Latescibacterota bacterium]
MRFPIVLQVLSLLWLAVPVWAGTNFLCADVAPASPDKAAKITSTQVLGTETIEPDGNLNALVIFAQFAGEGAGNQAPGYAEDLFDPTRRGSFAHFYRTMSFGRLQVGGQALSRRYSSRQAASTYLSPDPTKAGDYGRFVLEILAAADRDIDFGQFDNDGPDGVPNSGDDDGVVDYLFVNLKSAPANFLLGPATGIADLGFERYETEDETPRGRPIRIAGSRRWGTILQAGSYAQTVGVMAHEFGHSLGLPDLFDKTFIHDPDQHPADDGAGIGRWGLMGLGALGWKGNDGPVGFSAWSLAQLGWISVENGRLVEIEQASEQLEIADIFQGGAAYQLLLRQTSSDNITVKREFLLLEQRVRGSHYYNRNLPAEGLLVWHVRPDGGGNSFEQKKLLDLVCADGRYSDRGYPQGRLADPLAGGDNLDFWAHDPVYRETHSGNDGDATDPFDGVRFTRLDRTTNPSTNTTGQVLAKAENGVALNMQRRGDSMLVDVELARWAGVIDQEVQWVGDILIDGDLTIVPGGKVSVQRGARIRVAGRDRLAGGRDPELVEIHIQGDFILPIYVGNNRGPIPFEAAVPGESWYGLIVDPALGSRIELPQDNFVVRDAVAGIVLEGAPEGVFGVVVDEFRVLDSGGTETAGNGDGQPAPGESFQVEVQVSNWTLASYESVWAELSWEGDLLQPTWPQGEAKGTLRTESFRLSSGAKGALALPSLTVSPQALPGQRVEVVVEVRRGSSVTRVGSLLGEATAAWTVQGEYADYPVQIEVPGYDVYDGSVLLDPDQPMEVQVTTSAAGVDMVVHALPNMEPVLEQTMARRGPAVVDGTFSAVFDPPRRGQYLVSFRLRGPQGVSFSPTRLQAVALVERWNPVLILADDPRVGNRRAAVFEAFSRTLRGLDLDYTWLDVADTGAGGGGTLFAPLLNRYLAEGHVVVWLGGLMDAAGQEAFRRFLQQGGKLLLASVELRLSAGIDAFFQDMLYMNKPARTAAARMRFVEGFDATAIDLFAYYGVLDIWPPARPLLLDTGDRITGAYIDAGYKAVYLPFSLNNLQTQDRQRLLDGALRYLYSAPVARANLQVEGLQHSGDLVRLEPLRSRIVVVNAGNQVSGPFGVRYQVATGEQVLYVVEVDQAPLAVGQQRQVDLPDWVPEQAGEMEIRVELVETGQEIQSSAVVRAVRVVGDAGPYIVEELPATTELGNGVGFFDFDGDGDLDLFHVRKGAADQLFSNGEEGFREVAAGAGVNHRGDGRGLAVGDADGDGDLDLYVTNEGPNLFYLNEGDGTFAEAAEALDSPATAQTLADGGSGRSAVFFDYDRDGDLDLYLANARGANRLYANWQGRFSELAAEVGLADDGNSRGAAVGDYDGDGDLDLYVTNQAANRPSRLYRNEGLLPGRRFTPVESEVGLGYQPGEVAGIWADYDDDGDLDLVVGNQVAANKLYRNNAGRFVDAGVDLGGQSVGVALYDYDNDGDLDAATTALEPRAGGDQLFQNNGGVFAPLGLLLGLRTESAGRGLAYGDYDDDGDLDLFVADNARSLLYRNRAAKRRWVRLELQGPEANAQGLGARIAVWSQGQVQFRQVVSGYGYCSQTDARPHLGLDQAGRVDSVRVFWPDGLQTLHRDMPADTLVQLVHPVHSTQVQGPVAAEPGQFALGQNFPNPFNSGTSIDYWVPAEAVGLSLEMAIYNLQGQKIAVVVSGSALAGAGTVRWNGRNQKGRAVASGVYLYRLQVGDWAQTRKLSLVR